MAEGSVGRSLFSRAPWIVFVHAMRRMGLSLRWHLVLGLLLMAYFVESAPATRPCSVSSSQWPVSAIRGGQCRPINGYIEIVDQGRFRRHLLLVRYAA